MHQRMPDHGIFLSSMKMPQLIPSEMKQHHQMLQERTEHWSEFGQQHRRSNSPPWDRAHSTISSLMTVVAHSCAHYYGCSSSLGLGEVVDSSEMVLSCFCYFAALIQLFSLQATLKDHLLWLLGYPRLQREALARKNYKHPRPKAEEILSLFQIEIGLAITCFSKIEPASKKLIIHKCFAINRKPTINLKITPLVF